jgi:hypothetical protein
MPAVRRHFNVIAGNRSPAVPGFGLHSPIVRRELRFHIQLTS